MTAGAIGFPLAMVSGWAHVSPAGANGVPLTPGNVLASTGAGQVKQFTPAGNLGDSLDTTTGSNETTGMCVDSSKNLYVTDFAANTMGKFDSSGNLLVANWGTGFNDHPESCTVDAANNIYVGQPDGTHQILKFGTSGNLLASYDVAIDARGTDWIDLASDQCTIYHAGEGSTIARFNVCTNTQLAPFATGLPAPCFELRIRPDGDVIVACGAQAVRLDSAGNVLQTYPIPGSSLLFVGGIAVSQPTLTLSPQTATRTAGTTHTVTATITNPGGSIAGQPVNFSVSGANSASGSGTTNANRQVTFTYTGTNVGSDTITGTFTGTSAVGTAHVTWVGSGACTMAVGRASTGPGDVARVVSNLSTTLSSAQQFQGKGTATLDGVGGYSLQFAIGSNATGNWVVAVHIKMGSTIGATIADALPVSTEVIS